MSESKPRAWDAVRSALARAVLSGLGAAKSGAEKVVGEETARLVRENAELKIENAELRKQVAELKRGAGGGGRE